MDKPDETLQAATSFFDRAGVQKEIIPIGQGVPLGIERVSNPEVGISGVYGAWGESYSNERLPELLEDRLGEPLEPEEKLNLSELGFDYRHHLAELSDQEHVELEIEVGKRFLIEAARANGWEPGDVDAVLIGSSGPVMNDYTEQIAREAGIPDHAIKVSIHKACDGSVGGLHLALNPDLPVNSLLPNNLGRELVGKKVLVGGIEGLSRFMKYSRDKNALQLFGNGAGVIGIIPGQTMKFLAGRTHEVFDEEGVLQVRMVYPHSGQKGAGNSMLEVTQVDEHHFRVAGLMHQPESAAPVVMAGPMGMVKLFVRTGVQVVLDVYQNYQRKVMGTSLPGKAIAVAVVHHANLKINQLKEKHLQREGIHIPMPWLIRDFGNVSAASNMIAFLRQLPSLRPSEYILIDGFGAGTYYDVVAVELGG